MRLFHVSEESDIVEFIPRIPYRQDMDKSKGLVWALTEQSLPNWLTPRNCPRVGYRATDDTTQDDISRFFSSSSRHCVAIEHRWYKRMATTSLYVYEFDATNFYFDENAGFYVSDKTERPTAVTPYNDLFEELFSRNVEVRILNNLWAIAEAVKKLRYSGRCAVCITRRQNPPNNRFRLHKTMSGLSASFKCVHFLLLMARPFLYTVTVPAKKKQRSILYGNNDTSASRRVGLPAREYAGGVCPSGGAGRRRHRAGRAPDT